MWRKEIEIEVECIDAFVGFIGNAITVLCHSFSDLFHVKFITGTTDELSRLVCLGCLVRSRHNEDRVRTMKWDDV